MYSQSERFLILLLFVLLMVAGEIGYWLGRKRSSRANDHTRIQSVTIQAAILGLLGLLLGFTFAMAISRFDASKRLVVDETSAIGTVFQRARLVPDPEQTEILKLLQAYVTARLDMTDRDFDPSFAKKETRLQELLWIQVIAAMEKDRRAVPTGLLVQSMNDMFDSASKRDAALDNHVPESVLVLLFVVSTLSVAVVGHGCGLGHGRPYFAMLTLSVLIAVVVLIIIDLDRPRQGLIRISQKSMVDLKRQMEDSKLLTK